MYFKWNNLAGMYIILCTTDIICMIYMYKLFDRYINKSDCGSYIAHVHLFACRNYVRTVVATSVLTVWCSYRRMSKNHIANVRSVTSWPRVDSHDKTSRNGRSRTCGVCCTSETSPRKRAERSTTWLTCWSSHSVWSVRTTQRKGLPAHLSLP